MYFILLLGIRIDTHLSLEELGKKRLLTMIYISYLNTYNNSI